MTPDLFEVVRSQRACRWFSDEPVPDDDIGRLLEAAVRAPSAENTQPWEFVVVRADAPRKAIDDLARRLWFGGARDHAAARVDDRMLADLDGSIEAGFGRAPVLIVVAANTVGVHPRALASSMFPAVQNLLLAAAASGYGSALTTLVTVAATELRAAIGLPDHVEPVAVVPIGRPARPLGPSRREPISAKTHLDHFGTPWSSLP